MPNRDCDDWQMGFALQAAAKALEDEVEPRKLLVAALAVRSSAPKLAMALVTKARRAVRIAALLPPSARRDARAT